MIKHPYLKLAEKSLKNEYHINFIDKNILEVALDKDSDPFAFLVVEQEFDGVLLSLSHDFPETYIVASLTILLMRNTNVALGEPFYRSRNGDLYWGPMGFEQFMMEHDSDLLRDLEPISDTRN